MPPAMVHAALTFSTVCGWVTIAILAVAPSGAWPNTGLRGNFERACLFFVVAAVMRATITHHETRWQIAVLAAAAALFELGRARIGDQSDGVAGWASSAVGAFLGAALLHFVSHKFFWQWRWRW